MLNIRASCLVSSVCRSVAFSKLVLSFFSFSFRVALIAESDNGGEYFLLALVSAWQAAFPCLLQTIALLFQ